MLSVHTAALAGLPYAVRCFPITVACVVGVGTRLENPTFPTLVLASVPIFHPFESHGIMGCAESTESSGESPSRIRRDVKPAEDSDDSKYRADQASEASSSGGRRGSQTGLSKDERVQVETIKQRRRSLGRPCSLAADDSMRHYRLVTGNIRDDDDYYDATRIRVRSGRTMSWVGGGGSSGSSDGGSPLLSRRSSIRRGESFSSNQALRKSVSFTTVQSPQRADRR